MRNLNNHYKIFIDFNCPHILFPDQLATTGIFKLQSLPNQWWMHRIEPAPLALQATQFSPSSTTEPFDLQFDLHIECSPKGRHLMKKLAIDFTY